MESDVYRASEKRTAIGKFSGLIGILCNFLLAGSKLIIGGMSKSMSIVADGLNNMSDAASSVVTLIGFKLAEKPADREHPYGHARLEYLSGLTVAAMILVIGFELVKSSVEKIMNPVPTEFSTLTVCILIGSILVKAWMMLFNTKMGKKIQSTALIATAEDSRNDVITTFAVLIAGITEHFTGFAIDGIMGIAVSLFVVYSGIMLAKKTISPLLGEGANPDLQKRLIEHVTSYPFVLGCHDLMVHDYGPGRRYASIHVEIDKNEDPMKCHEVIDRIERECYDKLETHLVIHYDPIVTNDAKLNRVHKLVTTILKIKDERLSVHDFRMSARGDSTELIFDMVVPCELRGSEEKIKDTLEKALNNISDKKYTVNITYDLET